MIHALVMLLVLGSLMHAGRSFLPSTNASEPSGGALAFGFLLLGGHFFGTLFAGLRLPRLTGYIVAGILAGPSVLGMVSRDMVRALGPIQGVAICLIALAAGGELNLKRMRPLFGTIGRMVIWVVGSSAAVTTAAVYFMSPLLPFLSGVGTKEAIVISAVLGVSLAAMSPAVVMALLSETRSDGPLSRTILGVVVAADLAVIVLFALIASMAQGVLGGAANPVQTALHVSWELLGSAVAGAVVGLLLAVYLRKVREGQALFVLLVCVVMSEVGSRLALDPLIVALTAGLFMENVVEIETTKLIHEIEAGSLPVYIVFFAVAGAALRLDVLAAVAVPAAVLVLIRTASIYFGSRAAARGAGAPLVVQRWAFAAFLPQAGLALALPLLYPEVLPGLGHGPATLVLGVVGINQVLMPVLLRIGLLRSGETGQAPSHDSAVPPPVEERPAPAQTSVEMPRIS